MKKTYEDYILTEDFEGAKVRFETTNKRWKQYWWNCLTEIYETCKRWAKKYILDPINRTVSEAIVVAEEKIIYNCTYDDNGEKCYLFKFYDFFDNLIFSKIGTTTKNVTDRLIQEINSYSKHFEIFTATVESVINCNLPAVGAESYTRAVLIKNHPESFLPNDRFLMDISVEEFNSTVLAYLN